MQDDGKPKGKGVLSVNEIDELRRDLAKLEVRVERVPVLEAKLDELARKATEREVKQDEIHNTLKDMAEAWQAAGTNLKWIRGILKLGGLIAAVVGPLVGIWYTIKGLR